MTYDEHWASSPEAGSVASLPWVRKGLERILEQVPAEKLLLGIPFYTRLWQETPLEDGAVKVVSKAYSMDQVRSILAEKGAVPVWDETDGQYYAEYEEDGNTFKVWLEDETSVRSRVDLMKEYSLAGIASWEMGNESDGIWEAILEELTARP